MSILTPFPNETVAAVRGGLDKNALFQHVKGHEISVHCVGLGCAVLAVALFGMDPDRVLDPVGQARVLCYLRA